MPAPGYHQPPLLVSVCMVLGAAQTVQAISYQFTDLNLLPSSINNNGQIVGTAIGGPAHGHAVLYSGGVVTELPVSDRPGFTRLRINNTGDILGCSMDFPSRPLLYHDGQWNELGWGNLPGGDYYDRYGIDLNNYGQVLVTGYARSDPDLPVMKRSFVYGDGPSTWPGSMSEAVAINDTGQTIMKSGLLRVSDGSYTDLSPLLPRDINDNGQVVGEVEFGGLPHVALWSPNGMTVLDTAYGEGISSIQINNVGQIVGISGHKSFLYSDGAMYDLTRLLGMDTSGWVGIDVSDMNDAGAIVGTYSAQFKSVRGFILTPVPEPNSLLLLTAGVLPLMRRRKRPSRIRAVPLGCS